MKHRLSVFIVGLLLFSLCIPDTFIYGGLSFLGNSGTVVFADDPPVTPPPSGMPPPEGMNPPSGDGQGKQAKPGGPNGPGGQDSIGGQDSQGGQKGTDTKSVENGILKLREDIKQIKAAITGFEAKKLDLTTDGKMAVYQKELFLKQLSDLDAWYQGRKAELSTEKELTALKAVYSMEKKSIESRMKKLEIDLARKPPEGDSEKILKQLEKNISEAKKALEKKTAQMEKLLAQLKKISPESKVLIDPSDEEPEPLPDENP